MNSGGGGGCSEGVSRGMSYWEKKKTAMVGCMVLSCLRDRNAGFQLYL